MTKKKHSKKKSANKQKKASTGKEYIFISYFFVLIFVAMIGYLVYFQTQKANDFQNSAYNTRGKNASEKVVRGAITASGGEILANTEVDGDGNETRVYPYGRVFSHVVGYMGHGGAGLEATQDFSLLTSNSFILDQIQKEFLDEKKAGDTVVTTLDADLQQTAYDALGDYKGAIVVLEASTGKILAMVSKPDFNPNSIDSDWEELTSSDTNSNLVNRATSGLYPPGSTFKVVTALAYYRQYGNVDSFSFTCNGELEADDYTIHCYEGEVHGEEDFTDIFANSCNTAFASIGLSLTNSVFKGTAEDLLFNKDLPLPTSYKSSSFTLDGSAGKPLTMQTAIGQGNTLVTPIHMAMITQAIANNGVLMKPYLVDHIENDSGTVITQYNAESSGFLMTTDEASLLQTLMESVVRDGTAKKLNDAGYTVAGKTGTADYRDEDGNPHSWFIGYSNVDDPDIVVSVIVEGAGSGSKVAVPAARAIFDTYYSKQE